MRCQKGAELPAPIRSHLVKSHRRRAGTQGVSGTSDRTKLQRPVPNSPLQRPKLRLQHCCIVATLLLALVLALTLAFASRPATPNMLSRLWQGYSGFSKHRVALVAFQQAIAQTRVRTTSSALLTKNPDSSTYHGASQRGDRHILYGYVYSCAVDGPTP